MKALLTACLLLFTLTLFAATGSSVVHATNNANIVLNWNNTVFHVETRVANHFGQTAEFQSQRNIQQHGPGLVLVVGQHNIKCHDTYNLNSTDRSLHYVFCTRNTGYILLEVQRMGGANDERITFGFRGYLGKYFSLKALTHKNWKSEAANQVVDPQTVGISKSKHTLN